MSQAHKKLSELQRSPLMRVWDRVRHYDSKVHFIEFSLCFVLALLLVVMIRQDLGSRQVPRLTEGEIATRTLRSKVRVEFDDPDSKLDDKQQLLARVSPVYDFDQSVVSDWTEQWKGAVRSLRGQPRARAATLDAASEAFGFSVRAEEAAALARLNYDADVERSINFALADLNGAKIIDRKPEAGTGIELLDVKNSKSKFVRSSDFGDVLTLEEARRLVTRAGTAEARTRADGLRRPWTQWPEDARVAIFSLQSRLVKANITPNRKESELRKELALRDFRPQTLRVEKGEVIVREGEKVSRKASLILTEMNRKGMLGPVKGRTFFEALFGSFFLWLVMHFLRRQFPKALSNPKNTAVGSGILLTSVAAFKLMALFSMNVVADYFTNIPASFFLFLIPIAAPAMITRLLMQIPYAALLSAVLAGAVAVMLDGASAFGAHALAVSLMSIHFLDRCPTRTSLHIAGLRTAVIAGLSSLAVLAAWGGDFPAEIKLFNMETANSFSLGALIAWTFVGGFVGGWISSALALILTPILENILDYTTELKLLELARMDNPLLRDLVLKAPGTYHHSIVVGSLAEAACDVVGANSLLARVGSYYHDIGKIGRAEYFVENQMGGVSPHDQVSPHMSAKIIISHVKEGMHMALEAKLGEHIMNFIESHHGTSLVAFFFNKAKQAAAKPSSHTSVESVNESDFRYPGPKPHTKEAAIVALADSCEAATRSLVDPTPARIEGMVTKIISRAYNEGLLDEADITLREVNLVGQAFVRILLGIHHNRIQYPDQEKGLPPKVESPTLSFIKSRRSS